MICFFLMYVSDIIGKQFEELSISGERVGEPSKALVAKLVEMQNRKEDTSCSLAEEGQYEEEMAELQDEEKKTA